LQTTLLGLAIAIILALITALVGPLVIDWGGHRSLFEAEASRLIGLDMRVNGDIEVRLLPSLQLTLHDIEIGSNSENRVHARALGFEFALGPLMRGQWRASDVHLVGPEMMLGLDASGYVMAPNLTMKFSPDNLSIDRLSVEDGKITLTDVGNGGRTTLEQLWFTGEARSLLGPVQGEGAATVGGELYPFRIAAGRYSDEGSLKLHLNIDPVSRPLSIEAEGVLALAGGAPKFDGTLSLTRPVGIASGSTSELTQPWRVSGRIRASAASALMQQFEFLYGSEEQGFKLTGVAEFKFGSEPRFYSVLSGRQIDLDRALASDDGSHPAPAAAIRQIAAAAWGASRPAIRIQIGVGIDQVVLGGRNIANVRGDISTDAKGWNLDRFEFRAPGFTQVRLSGRLAVGGDGVSFTGPVEIDAGDSKLLAAWLEGRADAPAGEVRPLNLRGDVVLGSQRVAVERLEARFDRKTVTGRLAYIFASGDRRARLDAALDAPELDIDAALGFGNALLAGSNIERPGDVTIAANIGRATIAGLVARNSIVQMEIDAGGFRIDRLSIADLGGASFSASGRLATAAPSLQGNISVDLYAPDIAPVISLLARFATQTAQVLRASTLAPTKLHAQFSVDGAKEATIAKLAVDGNLGKVHLELKGQSNVDPVALTVEDLRLDGKLEATDGKALVAVLGLDRVFAVSVGPGTFTFKANGPRREWRVEGRLIAGGLDASLNGNTQVFSDNPSATLRANVARADIAPLRGAGRGDTSLPMSFATNVALTGERLTLNDINCTVAGVSLHGKLGLTFSSPRRVQGDIDADSIDAAGLLAAAVGVPASASSGSAGWTWSNEPFNAGIFGDYAGQIVLKARRVELLPKLPARDFRATLRFGKQEFAFDDASGTVGGGWFVGNLSFWSAEEGLKTDAKISLSGVDAASVLPYGGHPPVSGTVAISAEAEGRGLSPIALISSLQGSGTIALNDGQFAGLDPRTFDVVSSAVDQGMPIDVARISDAVGKAMASGSLAIKRAEGMIAISAGQIRLNQISAAKGKDGALSLAGNLDLTEGSIDARLVLSGSSSAAGARPSIYVTLKGPVVSPIRGIDVSALTGWLTLRAIENQAAQIREIERRQPKSDATPPRSESAPALPAPVDVKPGRTVPPEASVRPQN
jgi:uncharacterized protein involved in outer membrane biogenesis